MKTTKQEETKKTTEQEVEFETTINKENEHIENETFMIDKIILVLDKEGKYVTQARFNYEDETLFTYNPKLYTEVKEMIHGFETLKRQSKSYSITEIPEKLIKLNKLLNKEGEIKVSTGFMKWNTKDRDNKNVTYCYLTEKDFNGLFVMDENNKEIVL